MYSAPTGSQWLGVLRTELELIELYFGLLALKGGYKPSQLRAPAGTPEGGQWTDTGRGYARGGRVRGRARLAGDKNKLLKRSVLAPGGKRVNRINIFVGGFFDSVHKNLLASKAFKSRVYGENYYASYDDDGVANISDLLVSLDKNETINLIGHSWGADTAAKIALANPGKVDMLVTLDPVSRWRPDYEKVRESTGVWINIYASGAPGTRTDGDELAGVGRQWKDEPKNYVDLFVYAPVSHEQVDSMLGRQNNNGVSGLGRLDEQQQRLKNESD